jgi:hypothetical protein
MRCTKCGNFPVAVYRINEKGVPGIFHCLGCLNEQQKIEHEEDIDFCETIARGDNDNSER